VRQFVAPLGPMLNFVDGPPGAGLPDIAWQRHYAVDDQPIAAAFGQVLSDRMADLIDIAMAVYVADRLRRREPAPRSDPFRLDWYRSISIRLGLREPAVWRSPAVQARLSAVLGWLTEDDWTFEFMKRNRAPRPSQAQGFLFATKPMEPVTVGLFSGGLDSLVGACELLTEPSLGDLILVSASSSTRLRRVQADLAKRLRSTNKNIISVRVPFNLTGATKPELHEISQRSRGFVFLALGCATAATAGATELRLFEHGIGAVNLPYLECQVGTHSTRSAHPATLRLFTDLLGALEVPMHISNPLLLLTKAEVCRRLPSHFHDLVAMSESCDGFPQRVEGQPRCGLCTACVLRAQALKVSGLSHLEDWSRYRRLPLAGLAEATAESWPGRAMLYQVEVLRSVLESPEPWATAVEAFPSLARIPADLEDGPLGRQIVRSDLLSLLGRYVAEWDQIDIASDAREHSSSALVSRGGIA